MAAVPPPSAPGGPEPPPLQYSLLLQHLVGEQRRPRAWDPRRPRRHPQPAQERGAEDGGAGHGELRLQSGAGLRGRCGGGAEGAGGGLEGRGGEGERWSGQPAVGAVLGGGGGGEEAAAQGPPCLIFLPLSLLQCLSQVPGRVLCQSAFLAKDRRAHSLSSAQHRLSARRVIGAGVCGIKGQAVCALAVAPFTLQR